MPPLLSAFFAFSQAYGQKNPIMLASPYGQLKVEINVGDKIYYAISAGGKDLLVKNHFSLTIKDGNLGENSKLANGKMSKGNETITPSHSDKILYC